MPWDGMNEMLLQHEEGKLTTMLGNMSSHAKQLTSHLTDATQELYKAHEEIQNLHKKQTLLSADLMSNTVKCTHQSSEICKEAVAEIARMKLALVKQRQLFSDPAREFKAKLRNVE
jgi:predicted  nucleic acid-binding Zn-ribbon protein